MSNEPTPKVLPELLKIGRALRALRKKSGYSAYFKAADEMKMTPSQYWRYEKGANIQMDTLLAILNFYDTSLEEFINEYYLME